MASEPRRARKSRPFLTGLDFDEAEADALIFGLCLAARLDDAEISEAAERALGRLDAALPPEAPEIDLPLGSPPTNADPGHVDIILRAIRAESRLALSYVDRDGRRTSRTICPIAFGMIGAADSVAGWCELRRDFRHFRLDRIRTLTIVEGRFWRRRRVLFAAWRASQQDEEW